MHIFNRRSLCFGMVFALLMMAGCALWLYAHFSDQHGYDLAWFRFMSGRLSRSLSGQSTRSLDIHVAVDPKNGHLSAQVSLVVELRVPNEYELTFFLNPGFVVSSASIANEPAHISRNGSQIILRTAKPLPSGQDVPVLIEYSGAVCSTALCAYIPATEQMVLPPFLFWYPFDFKSFSLMQAAVTLPEGMAAVAPPDARNVANQEVSHTISWQMPRPVYSMALVAGCFERARRMYGNAAYDVYWPSSRSADPEALFEVVSAAHGDFAARYGSDDFSHVAVVLSDACSMACNAGDSTIFLPWAEYEGLRESQAPYGLFMRLAGLAARNWWGGTVSGRWLTDKPEAGAWLIDSMAEYSAREALMRRYGRSAYLEHMASRWMPPSIPAPLNTVRLFDISEKECSDAKGNAVRAYGPAVAQMIALRVGQEAFDAACRNFFRVYRYSTVSYASFRQELELASATDLGESFHAWFDRSGVFDYAIMSLRNTPNAADSGPGQVSIVINNRGDFPLMSPIRIAFWTPAGIEFRTCEPGGAGGGFEFTLPAPASRAVLDPEFDTADMARANNIWPRRSWPIGVSAAPNGAIAWWTAKNWNASTEQNLSVLLPGADSLVKASLPQPIVSGPLWSPDSSQLAWVDGKQDSRTAFLYLWDSHGQPKTERHTGIQQLGGWEGGLLIGWRADHPEWALYDVKEGGRIFPACFTPSAIVPHAGSYAPAYSSESGGVLCQLPVAFAENGRDAGTVLLSHIKPYGGLGRSQADGALLYFERTAGVMRLAANDASPLCVCPLESPVRQPAFSPDGARAGWINAAGRLVLLELNTSRQRIVELPGETVSWSWTDSASVVALSAEKAASLPLLCYADYVLWRIPMDTLSPERIPVEPSSAS